MLKNYRNNILSENSLSDNDEPNAGSDENIALPYNHLEHNSDNHVESSENLDHISDNMDNHVENVDAKEMDVSTNSSLENTNVQDQWVGGLKSKLNDRRVQYKRKRDTE